MMTSYIVRIGCINRQLICAAYVSIGGVDNMGIFRDRNITLPHIRGIFSGHNKISLPVPFRRKLRLLPYGNLVRFTGEDKILSGAMKKSYRLRIIIVVICLI